MKTIKTFAAAIARPPFLSPLSPLSTSAPDDAQFEKAGVIVASGATDLSSLKSQLAAKADAAGAKAFTITSTSGNNLMHATAVIYK